MERAGGRPGLRAGVARAIITPPIAMPMMGFAGRGVATGTHDDLTATALVLEDPGGTSLALIACDLIGVPDLAWMATPVSRLTGIERSHMIVAASHTHYGPAIAGGADETVMSAVPHGPAYVEAYTANLVHQLAGLVLAAQRGATPCTVSAGRGDVRIGVNRRERTADGSIVLGQNPAGPADTSVRVVRVDSTEGHPLALIANHACHPVSLGGECTELSADFPGVMRGLVERELGAPCLFLQGAAGNINPLVRGWDWTHPARLGLALGAEVLRTCWSIAPGAGPAPGALAVARSTVGLPPLVPDSPAAAHELESQLLQELSASEAGSSRAFWAARRLRRVRRGLEALEGGPKVPPVEAELVAVRLDAEIAVVTAPGEIFTEIGQSVVARSPFRDTIYAAYANGSVGYVPTRAAYHEGGYEVTHACNVGPEAGELIEEESLRLLASLK
ncbi:MAG: neutral/alkaline non-lysosomal ceramidase N-terminal domain-containing protein [Candidatus Dormibacteraeota bacterium]|nr:neutral/alkaline non-lysosomal ceramidase N-terminal domain-containing protein [Candidatus Dormibacteraeota bacterium]